MLELLRVLDVTLLAVGFIGLVGILAALVFSALVVLGLACLVVLLWRDGAVIWCRFVRLVQSL